MEVSNRFDILASLPADEESNESDLIDTITSQEKQQINDKRPTKNFWEIPELIEKHIPCSAVVITKKQTSQSVTKGKKIPSVTKMKPTETIPKLEEQQDEIDTLPTVEVKNESTTCSYYPPQPYKFKPTSSNYRNQTMPKVNRTINVLPKHTSTRGNSKSCTHKI